MSDRLTVKRVYCETHVAAPYHGGIGLSGGLLWARTITTITTRSHERRRTCTTMQITSLPVASRLRNSSGRHDQSLFEFDARRA